jgi:hypothetical protein
MQEYDSKCLKMYLITLKVFFKNFKIFAPITKVNEGESNTPCPGTLEVTLLGLKNSATNTHNAHNLTTFMALIFVSTSNYRCPNGHRVQASEFKFQVAILPQYLHCSQDFPFFS